MHDELNLCECKNESLTSCKVVCTKRGQELDNEHPNQRKGRNDTAANTKSHTELANSSPNNVCGSSERSMGFQVSCKAQTSSKLLFVASPVRLPFNPGATPGG